MILFDFWFLLMHWDNDYLQIRRDPFLLINKPKAKYSEPPEPDVEPSYLAPGCFFFLGIGR